MSIKIAAPIRRRRKRPVPTSRIPIRPLISFEELPPREDLDSKFNELISLFKKSKSKIEKQEIRHELLKVMTTLLYGGTIISQANIKLVLSSSEWHAYLATLARLSRGHIKIEVPAKLKPYISAVEHADAAYRRPQDFKDGFHFRATELLAGYELAAECLHEILLDSPDMAQFLYPPLRYTAGGQPIGNPNSMPRMYSASKGLIRLKRLGLTKAKITISAQKDCLFSTCD